ncbi:hypothetical protein D4Q76_01720 [archaeon]|nr:MAG: hypothetical protein D4Q76_01720 [archaeon]
MARQQNEKTEMNIADGYVLKALFELSEEGKNWVPLEKIYKFADNFFGSYDERNLAHDLAVYSDISWIKLINYIPSLGKQISITANGREEFKNWIVSQEFKNQFYKSLEKIKDAAQ